MGTGTDGSVGYLRNRNRGTPTNWLADQADGLQRISRMGRNGLDHFAVYNALALIRTIRAVDPPDPFNLVKQFLAVAHAVSVTLRHFPRPSVSHPATLGPARCRA